MEYREEVQERVQRRLAANAQVNPMARQRSIAPVLRCGYCGGPIEQFGQSRQRKQRRYYVCAHRRRHEASARHPPLYVSRKSAEYVIWRTVEMLLTDDLPEEVAAARARRRRSRRSDERAQRLRDQLQQTRAEIAYNLAAARAGAIDVQLLAEQNAPLQRQVAKLESDLAALESTEQRDVSRVTLREAMQVIASDSAEGQRALLSQLFSRIDLLPGHMVFRSHDPEAPALVARLPRYYSEVRGVRPEVEWSLE